MYHEWVLKKLIQQHGVLLVGKPQGHRSLVRPRRRWKDNIKIDLGQIGCGDGDLIKVPQDKVQWRTVLNTVMCIWVS
jgi:hypothetical protein